MPVSVTSSVADVWRSAVPAAFTAPTAFPMYLIPCEVRRAALMSLPAWIATHTYSSAAAATPSSIPFLSQRRTRTG